MNDKNEFILHIAGLIVLSALAVFFAILQAKYKVEITDVGIIRCWLRRMPMKLVMATPIPKVRTAKDVFFIVRSYSELELRLYLERI